MMETKRRKDVRLDLDLMHAVAHAVSEEDLRVVAERFCSAHDFSYWIYALAGPDKAITNYPDQLVQTYAENRWHQGSDPLVNAILRRHRALSWDLQSLSASERLMDADQRRLMDWRWEIGARNGVTAAAYDRRGNAFDYAIMSFSRDRPLSETARRQHEPQVQLLATYFLSAAQHIFGEPSGPSESEPIALTPRERECLSWVAIGKSSWEIGRVLGITEATVNFHLGNVTAKLGVRGRILAVSKAIRLGLINPA